MKRSDAGFTLFELIVSISLMLLLFSALSTIFTAGIGVYKTYDKGLSPYEGVREAVRWIETDIFSIIAPATTTSTLPVFEGTQTSFRCLTVHTTTSQITAVEYRFDANTKKLTRTILAPTTPGLPSDFSSGTTDTIAESVQSFSVQYYPGETNGEILINPQTSWTDTATMPTAVRITITLQDTKYPDSEETFMRLFAIRNR